MTPHFPHTFPCLCKPDNKAVLFCGAGLSCGLVPFASDLVKKHHATAETKLGVTGRCDQSWQQKDSSEQLYHWAEAVVEQLEQQNSPFPKLRLAKALGITTDPKWLGETGIAFSGITPRHRVIARFAKEGRWRSIWSFNWDCVLEKALADVGVRDQKPNFPTPWPYDHFQSHLTNDHLAEDNKRLPVHKPHGCVKSLREAEGCESSNPARCKTLAGRFMITASELKKRPKNPIDSHFFNRLSTEVSGHHSLTVGWRIGEKSLRKALINALQGVPNTKISVIDLKFRKEHGTVCDASNQQREDVFFQVCGNSFPTIDDLFLWIYALYTVGQMELQGTTLVDCAGKTWRETIIPYRQNSLFIYFVDHFLPTWTKLCWAGGLVKCIVNGQQYPTHKINLDQYDEYIPLCLQDMDRPDLEAAKTILASLATDDTTLDCKRFPGGIYDSEQQRLIIPLPCWKKINDLRALHPLLEKISSQIGLVNKISIFPVGTPQQRPQNKIVEHVRLRLAEAMQVPSFANTDNIEIIDSLSPGALNGTAN